MDYNFDAPMFVDFSNRGHIEQEDSDIDKWFDNRNGDDGGFELDSLEEDSENQDGAHDGAESTEIKQSKIEVVNASVENKNKEKDTGYTFNFFEDKTAPNLKSAPWTPRLPALQKVVATSAKEDEPPSKKKKAEPTRSTAASNAPRRSIRLSGKAKDKKAPTRSTKPMPKMKAPILTIPSTPTMMRRAKKTVPKQTVHKPREEQELETIAQLQNKLKQKRKENENFMKKALSAGKYTPYRSTEENLTQAHEFHFELDKRIKKPQSNPGEGQEKNFFDTLRKHPVSPSFKNKKPTKQQPFSFQTEQSRKRKAMDEEINSSEVYVPMALQCYKFQNSTPPRFRSTKDQNTSLPNVKECEKRTFKLTCPKTPNLTTKDRKRALPDDCLSRDQQEELDLQEMRNYKFKAQPFDPKIVEKQGTYGLKPQTPKTLTEPQPFNFASDQRSSVQKDKDTQEEEKPVVFKAQPVPEFEKIKFEPALPHTSTKQLPFSFDKRDKEITAKKEEKIQEILEEEKKAREFHAKPLQSFSPKELPSISKPNTKFEPFNLSTDNRGAMKAKKWKDTIEEELLEMRKKTVFKAHSSNVLYQVPFIPKKSIKPNTTFEEFNLNSERRAQERATYEMNKREKELEDEQLMLQREAEREEEEERNIALLRKQLVHKANPIRTYKQVTIVGSDKPLTQPESPAWNTRERKNMRV